MNGWSPRLTPRQHRQHAAQKKPLPEEFTAARHSPRHKGLRWRWSENPSLAVACMSRTRSRVLPSICENLAAFLACGRLFRRIRLRVDLSPEPANGPARLYPHSLKSAPVGRPAAFRFCVPTHEHEKWRSQKGHHPGHRCEGN